MRQSSEENGRYSVFQGSQRSEAPAVPIDEGYRLRTTHDHRTPTDSEAYSPGATNHFWVIDSQPFYTTGISSYADLAG